MRKYGENRSMGYRYINGGCFVSRGVGRHADRVIDSYELIYVVSGTLGMFEEDAEFRLSAGDRLLLLPGRRHGGLTPYGRNLVFQWHHFLPDGKREESRLLPLAGAAPAACVETVGQLCGLLQTESRLREAYPEKQILLNLLLEGLLNEISLRRAPEMRGGSSVLADRTENYLAVHFAEAVSTAVLAKEFGCSPDYLGRVFAQVRGCSIGTLLRRIRIGHAKKLLELSRMTIKETADLCGYPDLSYFHRQFLRETGMTPAVWRKRLGMMHINTE